MVFREFARPLSAAAGVAIVLSICGCGPVSDPLGPSSSASPPSASPSESSNAVPRPTPSEDPVESAIPVTIDCNTVISAEKMYAFSPSFVPLTEFTPGEGSMAAKIRELDGTTCRWVHESSGAAIDVSIARPGSGALTAAHTTASRGERVPNLGDAAFFAAIDGTGTTQVFLDEYWVVVESVYFSSPFDAVELARSALSSLE